MSSYQVIRRVTRELRSLLAREIESDSTVMADLGLAAGTVTSVISLGNPTETAEAGTFVLSMWLYQVTENEFVKNQPMLRGSQPSEQRFPPLALNLYYLLTPFHPTPEKDKDHLLLGKVMQILYDNAIVRLAPNADAVAEELRVVFCRLSLEELTRIWEALSEPYRLSVCYNVRVSHIDSERTTSAQRVIESIDDYQEKPILAWS